MILRRQKEYSRTYDKITDPAERTKKAKELLKKRKKVHESFDINKRKKELNDRYLGDLEKMAKGEPIRTENGKPVYGKLNEVENRYNDEMKKIDKYWKEAYGQGEGVSRKNLARQREAEKRAAEREGKKLTTRLKRTAGKVGKAIKDNKKTALIATGSLALGGAVYGGARFIGKKKADKKAQEMKKKVRGYEK